MSASSKPGLYKYLKLVVENPGIVILLLGLSGSIYGNVKDAKVISQQDATISQQDAAIENNQLQVRAVVEHLYGYLHPKVEKASDNTAAICRKIVRAHEKEFHE